MDALDLTKIAARSERVVENGAHFVLVEAGERDELVALARAALDFSKRVRGRDDLVGQIVMVLTTAAPAMDMPQRVNIAERLIDALGAALLVDGPKAQTANMPTGEKESMSLAEFLEREGQR